MPLEIRIVAHDSPEYWQIVDLRRRVLRTPLGLDFTREELMGEGADIHIAAFEDVTVLGVVILSPPRGQGAAHLRQMAIAPETQGRGIGAKLVGELECIALDRGWMEIALASRETAMGFYARLGYLTESEVYERIGIPHVDMRKRLSPIT